MRICIPPTDNKEYSVLDLLRQINGNYRLPKPSGKEDAVYETFNKMIFKLKSYRSELLGTLIRQMENMQDRTNISRERIRQIDREIADLGASNIVIARLHTSGVLNAAEHSMQTAEINNKITELRTERRKRLSEDENDELIDTLKYLNEILEEYEPTTEFDSGLFGQVIESITVDSNSQLIFERPITDDWMQKFNRTVKEIRLYKNKAIGVVLLNGQLIRKEQKNGTSDCNKSAESSSCN